MPNDNKLVVTRHKALYEYLLEKGYIEPDTPCVSKVDSDDVIGKHVYGVLPNWLAAKTKLYTEVQLRIPYHKRGKDLTIEEVRFLSYGIKSYKVIEIKEEEQRYVEQESDRSGNIRKPSKKHYKYRTSKC